MFNLPKVSIIIVNFNGLIHLKECFSSILNLNYPKENIEIILVDNGSSDGSISFVKNNYPQVILIQNTGNEGFAKPSDDGAKAATGEYVAFLNNDMKVTRNWLLELVKSLNINHALCAGSVIMDWSGKRLDFAGGAISFYGMGYQHDFHKKLSKIKSKLDEDFPLLFACGGAMIIQRNLFLEVGGFDEDYFAYFEDVDLGWRLNILGYKVILSVKSRVYHKHHGTYGSFAQNNMKLLYERNSLYTIYKNYSEEYLNHIFWPSLLLQNSMIIKNAAIRRSDYDLQANPSGPATDGVIISHLAAAELCALNDFIQNLASMQQKRSFVQKNRKINDQELVKYFPDPFYCLWKDESIYHNLKYDFSNIFGIDKLFDSHLKRKIVFINDGIRKEDSFSKLVEQMKSSFEVVIAEYGAIKTSDQVKRIQYDQNDMLDLIKEVNESSVVFIYPSVRNLSNYFSSLLFEKYIVIDLRRNTVFKNTDDIQWCQRYGDAFILPCIDDIKDIGQKSNYQEFIKSVNEKRCFYLDVDLVAWDKIGYDLMKYCANPTHPMKRITQAPVPSVKTKYGAIPKRGVLPNLELLEQKIDREATLTDEMIMEMRKINEWMFKMDNRYSRVKRFAGRFRLLKRFLNQ